MSLSFSSTAQRGLAAIEVVVILVILLILGALLLPAVRSSRESARRMQCSNHMKQLSMAVINYHATHKRLPSAMGGTADGETERDSNAGRLSGLVSLLPLADSSSMHQKIFEPGEFDGITYPAMGPVPWYADYAPWTTQISFLRCPSSEPTETSEFGITSYTFCVGDVPEFHSREDQRGVFLVNDYSKLNTVGGGASNTVALAEIGNRVYSQLLGQFAVDQPPEFLQQPAKCLATIDPDNPRNFRSTVTLSALGRGARWADGGAGNALVNTILPPNSASCAVGGSIAVDGYYSAGSMHVDGATVAMLDGSVRFIGQDIDCGNLTAPPVAPGDSTGMPSPYGVWGALGSVAGSEAIEGSGSR